MVAPADPADNNKEKGIKEHNILGVLTSTLDREADIEAIRNCVNTSQQLGRA